MNNVTKLRPVSVRFLYVGMAVKEDVYDSNATGLLLRAGRVITPELLEKIKNANKQQECIYVSEATYRDLRKVSKLSDDDALDSVKTEGVITVNKRIESMTGYSGIIAGTSDVMEKFSVPGEPPLESLYSVTDELADRLKITKSDIIFDIINALAPADEYLRRHVVNVGMLNGLIGRWLGVSEHEINMLVMIGLVHDCGKAVIPSAILDAPRKLSRVEFEVIKTHPSYGYVLLNGLPEAIREGALHHHEKIDGGGYPDNLRGDDISFFSRITSVSDIYDAMVSRRAYKEPMSPFKVLGILSGMRGKGLDTRVVDTFIKKMPEELKGKRVRLSDGTTGEIMNADLEDVEYPFVKVNGNAVKTSRDVYCVSML